MHLDEQNGALLNAPMTKPLDSVCAVIEHGQADKFDDVLCGVTQACNVCHHAVGGALVQMTLDASERFSMRHHHRLTKLTMPVTHAH